MNKYMNEFVICGRKEEKKDRRKEGREGGRKEAKRDGEREEGREENKSQNLHSSPGLHGSKTESLDYTLIIHWNVDFGVR